MSDENLKKVEAALFLAARFLSIDELVRLTDINPITLKEVLAELEKSYSNEKGALAIVKREVEGQTYFKMDIKGNYAHYINRIASGKAEFTKSEQATLAVIAYKQPIKQSIIIKIRGNKAYEHIKHFKQNDLVRARRLGRTFELALSDKFYDYFHVRKEEMNKGAGKEIEIGNIKLEEIENKIKDLSNQENKESKEKENKTKKEDALGNLIANW